LTDSFEKLYESILETGYIPPEDYGGKTNVELIQEASPDITGRVSEISSAFEYIKNNLFPSEQFNDNLIVQSFSQNSLNSSETDLDGILEKCELINNNISYLNDRKYTPIADDDKDDFPTIYSVLKRRINSMINNLKLVIKEKSNQKTIKAEGRRIISVLNKLVKKANLDGSVARIDDDHIKQAEVSFKKYNLDQKDHDKFFKKPLFVFEYFGIKKFLFLSKVTIQLTYTIKKK
jgi:hypothetical protein